MTGDQASERFKKADKAFNEGRLEELEVLMKDLLPSDQEVFRKRLAKRQEQRA